MTEATQTATSTDAREASMSRVSTQDTVLAKLQPQEAAKVPPEGQKPEGEQGKDGGEAKPKLTAGERIQQLAAKRREAEAEADAERRRAAALEAELVALKARAAPIENDPRPLRAAFPDDTSYEDALAKWGGRQAIKEREEQQAKAQLDAEAAEIAAQWSKRQEKAMKELPDYADVLGKSEIPLPANVYDDLLDNDMGPYVAYFLALNPDEAKRVAQMKRSRATLRIAEIAAELKGIGEEDKPVVKKDKEDPKPQRSKAPEPIEPVKSSPSSSSGSSNSFDEYKRRRQASKAT